ncbi:MAG: hypothetical protein GAK37_02095 [Pseudomonas sp.]|nr:MAG: hypothetical protein GAK37_02095 [Pseudomonas sp.]
MKRFWLLCSACVLSFGVHAGPQINVGVVYDYLEAGKKWNGRLPTQTPR